MDYMPLNQTCPEDSKLFICYLPMNFSDDIPQSIKINLNPAGGKKRERERDVDNLPIRMAL